MTEDNPARRIAVLAILVVFALLSGVVPSLAVAATRLCDENETAEPAPENETGLLELQSNAARATFVINLDHHASGSDSITFNPKAGKRPGRDAVIAAEMIDNPRSKGRSLDATWHVGAGPNGSGRRVVLEACLENVRHFTAGRYEGTISIYGPKISDFTYAIVVTTKWPPWVPILVIVFTLLAFVGLSILQGQWKVKPPPGKDALKWVGYVFVTVVTLAIVIGLAAATYWSVYSNNETWGANPVGDLTSLFAASFAAATAGLALAHKLIGQKT